MKRIFASVLALTVATPALAGSTGSEEAKVPAMNAASEEAPAMDRPIVMDDSWDAEDLPTFDAPQVSREGWVAADTAEMTTEEMTGLRVYSANDEWIGEIDNLIVNGEGKIQGAVLGVGGFVGIGEKDVLVSFDSLTIKTETDGEDMRAYANMTEEQLEALPAYES